MSIRIDKEKCVSCGKCIKVCPGSLLYKDEEGKAFIKYPRDCWGCTACLKECSAEAVRYYLGADIGGKGTYLYTRQEGEQLKWFIIKPDGEQETVTINRKESNKY